MKAEHRIKTSAAAEHRKELHTNALADRMGRFMQTVRHRPKRRTVLIWVVGIAVILGLLVWYGIHRTRVNQNAELWKDLFDEKVQTILQNHPDTKQGQVAHLQLLYSFLWDRSTQVKIPVKGLKGKGTDKKDIVILGGIANIKTVLKQQNRDEVIEGQKRLFTMLEREYEELFDKVKEDKMLGSEALYNLGVVQETLAVYDIKRLEDAKKTFQRVRDEYKDTGHAVLADQRLQDAYTGERWDAMKSFYKEFGEKTKWTQQGEDSLEGE